MARLSSTGGEAGKVRARKASSATGRNPAKTKGRIAPTASRTNRSSVSSLGKELNEAREQQAATSELLKVIGRSTLDLQPVFETLAENAGRLCEAKRSFIFRFDGQYLRVVATHNVSAEIKAFVEQNPVAPGRASASARTALERRTVHVLDAQTDPEYTYGSRLVEPFRTILTVPMLKAGELLGVILVYRLEMRPFADSQIALLETFADQAVIAIENARLLTEQQEALERQTATAEVLQVINSSPGNLTRVFDVMLEKAMRLCEAAFGGFTSYDGERFHTLALRGLPPKVAEVFREPWTAGPGSFHENLVQGELLVHTDLTTNYDAARRAHPQSSAVAEIGGARTGLFIALRKDDTLLGSLWFYRKEVRPFSDKQIALVQNFAEQAVIAMENARLLDEIRHRNDELAEALEFQTASGEVLRIVASSPENLQSVFDAMLEKAIALCDAKFGTFFLYDGKVFTLAADRNLPPAYVQAVHGRSFSAETNTGFRRMVESKTPVHITDMFADSSYAKGEPLRVAAIELGGVRSFLAVPLLRKGELIGNFSIYRGEPGGFAENQIALVTTFADQAVIAIENARLLGELRRRTSDLTESLQQQTATADVLKVISRSAFDLQAVLDTLVESAVTLSGARTGTIFQKRGDLFHIAAQYGYTPEMLAFGRANPIAPGVGTNVGRTAMRAEVVQIPDVLADADFTAHGYQRVGKFRAMLGIPIMREGKVEGVFSLAKPEPGLFGARQVELVQTFADQAVIAIENVRLFEEVRTKTRDLQEALVHQTGSANILKVIASSPTDVKPVLEAIVESACELCNADDAVVHLREDQDLRYGAHHGTLPVGFERHALSRDFVAGRSVVDKVPVHIHDVLSGEGDGFPEAQRMSRQLGLRTILSAPMLRESECIGAIVLRRREVRPFTEKQIALLQTFADQAVIAIENVRLFDEVQAKTRDLQESLQQQTATADVLKVISRSAFDLQPVLSTLVNSAVELCNASIGAFYLREGDLFHLATEVGSPPAFAQYMRDNPLSLNRSTGAGRAASSGKVEHLPDVLADPDYQFAEGQRLGGYRSLLSVPLLREGEVIGVFSLARLVQEPFTQRQIDLVTTFADQAVIAVQNVRLFEEVQARTSELATSLTQQTATADVLKVISRSTFDLQTVLQTLVESLTRLTESDEAMITRQKEGAFYRAESCGFTDEFLNFIRSVPIVPDRGSATGRALLEGVVVHIPDVEADVEYTFDSAQKLGDFRALLAVPMLREGTPVGVILLTRREPRAFSPKQIGLATTFADQAAIAIENVRLFDQVQARTQELSQSLDDLRTAQDRLVQTEKLASLGQLTAGIAHEIKNPLNFVNNFAALSAELIDEMSDALTDTGLAEKKREELDELTQTLKSNLEKVVQHGKRADSIVKNMLLHSREGSGERRSADVNALVGESLNLAYHGARAEKAGFSITLKHDLDPEAGALDLYPQEITRALLNLISNGFYAATRRRIEAGDDKFEPVLSATTRNLGKAVEIRIRDNGIGIPLEVREKIFNPFFTTKPTGEGTGLGLSMAHDIIVKQHGGKIDVETEPGVFTEFIITLPRGSIASDPKPE